MPNWKWCAVIPLIILVACGPQQPSAPLTADSGLDTVLGPLPTERATSATTLIFGAYPLEASLGTTPSGNELEIDATGLSYAWARYGYTVPAGHVLQTISVDTSDVETEYWIALSNYDANHWEWLGPLTDDEEFDLSSSAAQYLNGSDSCYWVIVADADHQLHVASSMIEATAPPFEVPPLGHQVVNPQDCQLPSLVLMPEIEPNIDAGAPVIAYTATEVTVDTLRLACYRDGQWESWSVMPERSLIYPQALWLGDEGVIIAFDMASSTLMDLRFNEGWLLKSSTEIMNFLNTVLNCAIDYDPASGELGVAHVHGDTTNGALYFSSWTESGGWETGTPLHNEGDAVGGVTFKFDPAGGDPWLAYTHGTTETGDTIILDFALETGRRSGGNWSFSPANHPDNPLLLNLGFDDQNEPELVFTAMRDMTVGAGELQYTSTVLGDVVAGTKSGTSWSFNRAYESTSDWSLTLIPPLLHITIDSSPQAIWTAPGELIYSEFHAEVDISPLTLEIVDESIEVGTQYMVKSGSTYQNSSFFTSTPGLAFSWGRVGGKHACAYINIEDLSAEQLLSGDLLRAGELLYWSK